MKFDYRMQYYDVITNPRWRTTANVDLNGGLRRFIMPTPTRIIGATGCV